MVKDFNSVIINEPSGSVKTVISSKLRNLARIRRVKTLQLVTLCKRTKSIRAGKAIYFKKSSEGI